MRTPVGPPLLDIRQLVKTFGDQPPAVDHLDLQIGGGELVAVLGPNGSGKSTMLRCAARLTEPTSGSIRVAGHDLATLRGAELRSARRAVGMVFQQGYLVRRRTALRNATSGAVGRHRGLRAAIGLLPRDEFERALDCLERVGMDVVAHRRADRLSGGQAQRVAIARALVQSPQVLLADEPVASLDPEAAEGVLGVLADLARVDRLAVLAVLHQPEMALRVADRVVGMRAGRVIFDRPAAEVDVNAVKALYREEGP